MSVLWNSTNSGALKIMARSWRDHGEITRWPNGNDGQIMASWCELKLSETTLHESILLRQESTACTAASSWHEIWNREPVNLGAQTLTAMISTKSSKAFICKASSSMWLGSAKIMYSSKHVAPPRCKDESHVNRTSWRSRGLNTIIAEPQKCCKNVGDKLCRWSVVKL